MEVVYRGAVAFHRQVADHPAMQSTFRQLGEGQSPHTLVISCCDSRVDPNLILGHGPGELFVHRSIGNIVPPASSSDVTGAAAAVEFAVDHLGVSAIVVVGHSGCGAMKGVLAGVDPAQAPFLARWLAPSNSCIEAGHATNADALSRTNVVQQLRNLRTHQSVQKAQERGELQLLGMWFDIGSATMFVVDEETAACAPITEAHVSPLEPRSSH